MTRAILAELLKLRRRSVLIGAGAVLPLLAIVATVAVFASAGDGPPPATQAEYNPSLAELGAAGGMTRGFTAMSSFLGLLVLVVFIASTTSEWSQGTVRMLLTRQPRRLRVFAGKAVALLLVTAAALFVALLVAAAAAYLMAAVRNVPADAWLTGDGLGHTAGAWSRAALSVSCYGLLGMALGTLIRSTTVAVALAFAWFFPLEHIVQNAWAGAGRWFPGLLFEAVTSNGNVETGFGRAVLLGAGMVTVLVAVAAVDLRRRDISA
jgi:ABC-2 type transport system permease protein